MNKKALKGLKDSIKKWEGIINKTKRDEGSQNCPLCYLYFDDDCIGCPVQAKTGFPGCEGTPYDDWSDRYLQEYSAQGYIEVTDDKSLNLAKAELKFLKSLLPKKTAKRKS